MQAEGMASSKALPPEGANQNRESGAGHMGFVVGVKESFVLIPRMMGVH